MIVSIGIDIIEVTRIREALARTPRLAERVFTPAERTYCESRGAGAAQHYAARFAAKEAAMKALGTGWAEGIAWQEIEVINNQAGAPMIHLSGQALERFNQLGATRAHVTLSHSRDSAIAQVIFESE